MNVETIQIDAADLRKLLGAANGDAALLYLFIRGATTLPWPGTACPSANPGSAAPPLHCGSLDFGRKTGEVR